MCMYCVCCASVRARMQGGIAARGVAWRQGTQQCIKCRAPWTSEQDVQWSDNVTELSRAHALHCCTQP